MKLYTLLIAGAACALATSAFAQSRDTNGDGKIDKAETLAAARATFERMDANRDGRLSLGETTSGSEIDPDQGEIDETLTSEGVNTPASPAPKADPEPVKNTGEDLLGPGGDPAEGKRKDADAATG